METSAPPPAPPSPDDRRARPSRRQAWRARGLTQLRRVWHLFRHLSLQRVAPRAAGLVRTGLKRPRPALAGATAALVLLVAAGIVVGVRTGGGGPSLPAIDGPLVVAAPAPRAATAGMADLQTISPQGQPLRNLGTAADPDGLANGSLVVQLSNATRRSGVEVLPVAGGRPQRVGSGELRGVDPAGVNGLADSSKLRWEAIEVGHEAALLDSRRAVVTILRGTSQAWVLDQRWLVGISSSQSAWIAPVETPQHRRSLGSGVTTEPGLGPDHRTLAVAAHGRLELLRMGSPGVERFRVGCQVVQAGWAGPTPVGLCRSPWRLLGVSWRAGRVAWRRALPLAAGSTVGLSDVPSPLAAVLVATPAAARTSTARTSTPAKAPIPATTRTGTTETFLTALADGRLAATTVPQGTVPVADPAHPHRLLLVADGVSQPEHTPAATNTATTETVFALWELRPGSARLTTLWRAVAPLGTSGALRVDSAGNWAIAELGQVTELIDVVNGRHTRIRAAGLEPTCVWAPDNAHFACASTPRRAAGSTLFQTGDVTDPSRLTDIATGDDHQSLLGWATAGR